MRYPVAVVLLLLWTMGCSKDDDPVRTNFAEIIVDGQKFSFDRFDIVVRKTDPGFRCYFVFDNTATNSNVDFTASSGKVVNTYRFNGENSPGPGLESMSVSTYVDRMQRLYVLKNGPMLLTIDKARDGRMHGTLSGKITLESGPSYDQEVLLEGEFEAPYTTQ